MKRLFFLLALLLTGFMASAQNNGNQGSFVVSEAIIDDQPGTSDELIIRLSGPAANDVQMLVFEPSYTSRIASFSMSKEYGSAQGNGSSSIWKVTLDAESVTDPQTGDIEGTVNSFCCTIPQGGIVVRIKPPRHIVHK